MRIVVMGAGGVGGYFGARLAQTGEDVAFVARGRHLAAMRERGLTIRSTAGDATVKVVATEDPATLGHADLILFAVKLWDTEPAARLLRPLIGPSTVVVPFQNGVDSVARIGAVLGAEHVAGGAAQIAAVIAEPGTVVHTGTMALLRFGATQPGQRATLEAFAAACARAGFECHLVDDIELALWQKFIFLASFSGMTCMTRQSMGPIRTDPDMRATFAAAIREVCGLARARGIGVEDDQADKLLTLADTLPAEMRSSMLHDLESGNRLEAPWLSGTVARLAAQAGVPAPVHATMYAAVKPYVEGRR
jgi:2-dehydropantoate 2-reductase